jgi:hypothetical protein
VEQELAAMAAQFGAAGLIAWMWLTERRHSSARDRQLSEAHERMLEQRTALEQLLRVIGENTVALTGVGAGQQRIAEAIERLARSDEATERRSDEGVVRKAG